MPRPAARRLTWRAATRPRSAPSRCRPRTAPLGSQTGPSSTHSRGSRGPRNTRTVRPSAGRSCWPPTREAGLCATGTGGSFAIAARSPGFSRDGRTCAGSRYRSCRNRLPEGGSVAHRGRSRAPSSLRTFSRRSVRARRRAGSSRGKTSSGRPGTSPGSRTLSRDSRPVAHSAPKSGERSNAPSGR